MEDAFYSDPVLSSQDIRKFADFNIGITDDESYHTQDMLKTKRSSGTLPLFGQYNSINRLNDAIVRYDITLNNICAIDSNHAVI